MDAPSSERVLMRGSATASFWADGNRADQVAERFDFGMICRRMPASLLSAARGKADSLCLVRAFLSVTLNRHSGWYLFGSRTCAASHCPYPSEAGDLSLSRTPFGGILCRNLALPGMLESKAITQEELV
jgi:hypothetical protein